MAATVVGCVHTDVRATLEKKQGSEKERALKLRCTQCGRNVSSKPLFLEVFASDDDHRHDDDDDDHDSA